jgi:hypothetical protein
MDETPRPVEQRGDTTAVPDAVEARRVDADRDEPAAARTAAKYPLWLIIGGFVLFALVALYLAWMLVPVGP